MTMEIVKNPTQERLDDLMLEVITKKEEMDEEERAYYNYEYIVQKMIDDESDKVDESWKSIHKYKTDAEKAIRKTKTYEKFIEAKIMKKKLERDLSLLNQIYYHARNKITDDRSVDVRVSELWSLQQ